MYGVNDKIISSWTISSSAQYDAQSTGRYINGTAVTVILLRLIIIISLKSEHTAVFLLMGVSAIFLEYHCRPNCRTCARNNNIIIIQVWDNNDNTETRTRYGFTCCCCCCCYCVITPCLYFRIRVKIETCLVGFPSDLCHLSHTFRSSRLIAPACRTTIVW